MNPIPMKGGLDLRSAVTNSNPGTLYDCLNFEVALSDGYRRIDGFTRFDGRPIPSSLSVYTFRAQFANGEQGGGWGGLDGGIPFYDGFGINSGIWPPSSFDAFEVGDLIQYRGINGYDTLPETGGQQNYVYFSPAVNGVIIEAPEFTNVVGDDVTDVDLTVRTGQVFIPEDPGVLFNTLRPWIPNQSLNAIGRAVVYKGKAQDSSAFQGATGFLYGSFYTDMLVTGAWGNVGAYNVDLQPIEQIDWSAYNGATSGNFAISRQQVKEFPSGKALGMEWVNDSLYAVAETTHFSIEDLDSGILDIFEPRQWCYYIMSYKSSTDGIVGITDNRSLLPATSTVIRQHAHLIRVGSDIELLMPELDPIRSDADQEPEGSVLYLLTEVSFEGLDQDFSPGDLITTDGGFEAVVRAVFLNEDGTSGTCLVEYSTGSLSVGDEVELSSSELFVVTGIFGGSSNGNPLCTIGPKVDRENGAIMVKSTDSMGFQPINMGYEIQFDTGTNEPLTIYERPTDATVTDTDTGWLIPGDAISLAGGTNGWRPSSGDLWDAIVADDSDYAEASLGGSNLRTNFLIARDLGINIANVDLIKGIEVEIIAEKGSGTGPLYIDEVGYYEPDTEEVRSIVVNQEVSSKDTFVIGGPTDTFSAGGTSSAEIRSALFRDRFFGVAIKFRTGSGGSFPVSPYIYRVRVKVYYSEGTDQVWLYDPSGMVDIGTAQIVHKYVNSGTWAAGDAEGVLSLRGEQYELEPGMQIRSLDSGGGSLIADVVNGPNPCRLPGLEAIDRESSKYQFITTNFFASKDLRATFGVNGAGPAFAFSDQYFFFVRTGVEDQFAKPRHVGRLKDRLVLAYDNGNIDLSTPGDPANFDAVTFNATTLGVGEKVTGLLRLQGDALGVWTESSISAFQGADNDTFEQTIISPSSGAIEYTVADMGMPVFCDFRGISTVSTTEKYGDFERGRMSYFVESWLSPRLQGAWSGADFNQRVAGVLLVRNKNQYRVIFKDGYVLTMTVSEQGPEFTIQRYMLDKPDLYTDDSDVELDPVPPEWVYEPAPIDLLSTCAGVTNTGQDRIFMSARNYPYVLEMDRGVTFDGLGISSYLTLNLGSVGNPSIRKRLNELHVFGRVRGFADLTHQAQTDYQIPEGKETSFRIGRSSDLYYQGERPAFTTTEVNVDGRDVLLRINHESATDQPFTLQAYSWPDASRRRMER